MRNRTGRRFMAAGAGLAVFATAAFAVAHSGASGVVKERMDQMGATAKAMKAIAAMMTGADPYDPARVRMLATAIAARGGEPMTALFPEGSLMPPTEARAEIWTDWARFTALAADYQAAAAALADGADNPRTPGEATAPDALFTALGQTCQACHQQFRIKK